MEYYLGAKLRQLREDRRWSQKELASRLNKGVSTISGYESEAHPIPLDVLISVVTLFNISLDEFVGLEKPDSISVGGLNKFQVEILKELKREYIAPTNRTSNLSKEQLKILHDVIQSFGEMKESSNGGTRIKQEKRMFK